MKRDFDQVKFIKHNGVELPAKSTELAGAYDLTARGIIAWFDKNNVDVTKVFIVDANKRFREGNNILIKQGDRICLDTDLQLADVPEDFRGDIKPRSGLALKHGITVLNSPGLIDADYRQNIGVILINNSEVPFEINFNDRIAQFEPRVGYEFEIVSTDTITEPKSSRNGGFGSTGVNDKNLPNILDQEKITKEYGEFFEKVKFSVDDQGWTYIKEVTHLLDVAFENNIGEIEYQKSFGPSGDNPHWETKGARWRPKSLSEYFNNKKSL